MKALGKALAVVALLVLVGAGSATAAQMITGASIVDGTVTGRDVKKKTIRAKHLTDGAKAALKGAEGPAGPQGPAGQPGEDGSADRYALVRADGLLQNDKKGIEQAQVSHVAGSGIYCFRFPTEERPVAGAANGTNSDTVATLVIDGDGGIAGCTPTANVRVVTWDLSLHAVAQREFRLILEND